MKNFLPVCLLSLVACGQNTTGNPADKKDPDRYYSEKFGFSILKPLGWEMIENYNQMLPVLFLSAQENESDSFRENISIVVGEVGSISLDEIYHTNLKNMGERMGGFNALKEDHGSKNGMEYKKIVYQHEYSGSILQVQTCFFMKNGRSFIITCSALPGTFASFQSKFDEIAFSIEFF